MVATPTPSVVIATPTPSVVIATPTPLEMTAATTPSETLATPTPSEIVATTYYSHPHLRPQQNTKIIKKTTSETDVNTYSSRAQRRHHLPLKCRTTTSRNRCKALQVHTLPLTECVAEPMRPRWRRTQAVS